MKVVRPEDWYKRFWLYVAAGGIVLALIYPFYWRWVTR